MSDTPPNQSCSQTWINSSFMKNHLCSTGHFAIKGCLKRTSATHQDTCDIATPKMCIHILLCFTLAELPWEHCLLCKRKLLRSHLHHLACQRDSRTSWILRVIQHLPSNTDTQVTTTHSRHSCLSEPTFNHSPQQGIDCVYDINVVRVCPAAPLPLCWKSHRRTFL